MTITPNEKFDIFFATWGLLAITSGLVSHYVKDGTLKRRISIVSSVTASFIFFGFAVWFELSPLALLVMLPVLCFIVWFNIKKVKFCGSCGAYNVPPLFSTSKFCRNCGTSLGS